MELCCVYKQKCREYWIEGPAIVLLSLALMFRFESFFENSITYYQKASFVSTIKWRPYYYFTKYGHFKAGRMRTISTTTKAATEKKELFKNFESFNSAICKHSRPIDWDVWLMYWKDLWVSSVNCKNVPPALQHQWFVFFFFFFSFCIAYLSKKLFPLISRW